MKICNFVTMKAFMHNLVTKLLFIIIVTTLVSCDGHEIIEANIPVHRTVLVYMVANNSLGYYGRDDDDIDEMLIAAKSDGLMGGRLLVYQAPYPYSRNASLKEITADGVVTIRQYDTDQSSVSADRMRQVIADTKAVAPASDYGIILWSHASGWLQNGLDEPSLQASTTDLGPSTNSYGSDIDKNNTTNHMNITTLANVLDGENFSFVYFDCCYMANVEVAYELRHVTPYIVGSATELPAAGMRYDLNIPLLMQDGNPDLIQTARNTYLYYESKSKASEQTCTMSVIATAGLDELAAATRAIYASGAELSSSYTPQKFQVSEDCLYFDLANYVTAFQTDQTLQDRWDEAINNVIIYKVNTQKIWDNLTIFTHCGLSTYPISTQAQASRYGYSELQWYKDVASTLVE